MIIFLKIFIILLSFNCSAECDFKKDVSKVISLSGSSTVILKELGLLKKPKLHGVSVFNPLNDSDFNGRIYPGGIFLSHQALAEFDGSVVFYDESRELHKIFSSRKTITARQIKTRNQIPMESLEATTRVVSEFVSGCDEEIKNLKNKAANLQIEIVKILPANVSVVFYLGDFLGGRPPEMVMVNDGVVKFLIQEKKIKTYPSELAYVNWSAKILKTFPQSTLHVAIKDSGRNGEQKIKRSPVGMTLVFPGSLVPGLTQLEAFLFLAKSL